MASKSHIYPQSDPRRTSTILAFAGFIVLAVLASALTSWLLYTWGSGLSFALLFSAAVAIPVAVAAAPQALSNARAFPQLLTNWGVLWLLMYVSELVFRIRNAEAAKTNPLDLYAITRMGPELIISFMLMLYLGTRRLAWPKSLFRGVIGFLAMYATVCTISTFWSVYPSWTLYKSVELLLDVALMAAILASFSTWKEYRDLFNLTCGIFGITALWTWAGVTIFGSAAWDPLGRLIGVVPITSPNALGEAGAILIVVAIARLMPIGVRTTERAWYLAVLVFGAVTLIAAKTRNDIAACAFGVIVVLFFSRSVRQALALAALGGIVLSFTNAGRFLWNFLLRGQTQSELYSLTGRLDWWSYAWQQFQKHPWTGLGAYAGGRFVVLGRLGFGDTGSLHSDYIEALLGTSLWGLIPLLLALFGTWWLLTRFVRRSDSAPGERQLALECLGVLGILTVHSVFNIELIWHAPMPFLLVLGYAEFLRRRHQAVPQLVLPPQPAHVQIEQTETARLSY